jgi:hypothetical protein
MTQMYEERAALVHLAAKVSNLRSEIAELDQLIHDVVTPKVQRIHSSLATLQDEIRDLAGLERIDVEAGMQVAEGASRAGTEESEGRGDKAPH